MYSIRLPSLRTSTGEQKLGGFQSGVKVIWGCFSCGFFWHWARKKKLTENIMTSIRLFPSFGLEMDLARTPESSQLPLVRDGSSQIRPMGSCNGDPLKAVRVSVLHVTVSCSGLCISANFQWLISFWPSNGSNGANDKDKQGPLPGAKAEIFLVITTWHVHGPRIVDPLYRSPSLSIYLPTNPPTCPGTSCHMMAAVCAALSQICQGRMAMFFLSLPRAHGVGNEWTLRRTPMELSLS